MHYAINKSISGGALALLSTFAFTTFLSWSTPAAAMSYLPKACELAEDRYVTIKSTTGHYLHEQDDGTLAGNEVLGIRGVFVRKEASCGTTKTARYENIHTGKFLDYDLQNHTFVTVAEKPRYVFSETRINKELLSLNQHGYGLSMDWDGNVIPSKSNGKEDLIMLENAPELSTIITPMNDTILSPVKAALECAAKVVIAVDTSSSMIDVKNDIQNVLTSLINQAPDNQWQVTLMTFSNDAEVLFGPAMLSGEGGSNSSRAELLEQIQNITIGGGTNFHPALDIMVNHLTADEYNFNVTDDAARIGFVITDGYISGYPAYWENQIQNQVVGYDPEIKISTIGIQSDDTDMEEILAAISHTRPNGEPAVYIAERNLDDLLQAVYEISGEFCGPVILESSLCPISATAAECEEIEERLVTGQGGSVSGWWSLERNPMWPAEYGSASVSVGAYAGDQVNNQWVQWGEVSAGSLNTVIEVDSDFQKLVRKFNVDIDSDHVSSSAGSDSVRFKASREVTRNGETTWTTTASSHVSVTSYPLEFSLQGAWGQGQEAVASPTLDENGNVVIEIKVAAVNGMEQEVPVGVSVITRAAQSASDGQVGLAVNSVAPWQVRSGFNTAGFESNPATTQTATMTFTLEHTGSGLGSEAPVWVEFHVTGAGKSLVEAHLLHYDSTTNTYQFII